MSNLLYNYGNMIAMKTYVSILITVLILFTNIHESKEETLRDIVDLTWYFENNTIYWLGVQPFIFTKRLHTVMDKQFWLAMNEFCAGEHGGTHMDAPYHFNKNGQKLGQIPPKKFIVPGIVIDVSKEVEKTGANFTLNAEHIENWIDAHGSIQDNTLVLIKYGWSQYYPNKEKYLGPYHLNGKTQFPGISAGAAELLTEFKLAGVGVDVASVDPGFSTTFDAHIILTGHDFYLIENVKLLEDLPPNNFTLIALPMNIAEGTGAPVRLIAAAKGYI